MPADGSTRSAGRRGSRRELLAWIAVAAVPLAIGTGLWLPQVASAAVDLPDLTPEELVEFAESSEVDAFSGTIEQRTELGLPDLSAITGPGAGDDDGERGSGRFSWKQAGPDGEAREASDEPDAPTGADLDALIGLATGNWEANVYVDGSDARLQVLDQLAERNLYVSESEAWFVDSETQTATHVTFPDEAELERFRTDLEAAGVGPGDPRLQADAAAPTPPTPQQLLDEALAKLDATTEVSVGTDGRVAGRDAYELVLEPQTDDTLVGEIRIAVDGENGAALAASVTARGASEPAYSIGFSDVSFEAPDASALAFEPSEGTAVVEKDVTLPTAEEIAQKQAEAEARAGSAESEATPDQEPGHEPVLHGEGWTTVVEVAAPGATSELGPFRALGTRVEGGSVIESSLVSVLITDDGRVFAGAVPVEELLDVAGGA